MQMTTTFLVTDPVCGMNVEPRTAAGSSLYNGETYHFCSRGCEAKFDDAPEQFVSGTRENASCCSGNGHCH